jgi:hypothetical protein
MRFGLSIASAILLSAAWCSANTLTDPFGQSQSSCNLTIDTPYSTCDVIGDEMRFDIEAATFSSSNGIATLMIYLNSGAVQNVNGKLTLGSFSDGVTLVPGDVFFYNPTSVYDPSDSNTIQYLKYGVALTNHGSFTAGGLYSIGGGISTETAQTALNNDTADYYRRDETVLMTGSGTPVSSGAVSVALNGDGKTSAQYAITITLPSTTGLSSIESNGQIGLLFSSADCGNDVIQGTVGAPEPGPVVLILTGLVLLAAGRYWRKRKA